MVLGWPGHSDEESPSEEACRYNRTTGQGIPVPKEITASMEAMLNSGAVMFLFRDRETTND